MGATGATHVWLKYDKIYLENEIDKVVLSFCNIFKNLFDKTCRQAITLRM
jgi:hypothetical protein